MIVLIYAQKHLKVKLKLVGFNNYFLTLGIYNYARIIQGRQVENEQRQNDAALSGKGKSLSFQMFNSFGAFCNNVDGQCF